MHYASRMRRFLAIAIDAVLLGIVAFAINMSLTTFRVENSAVISLILQFTLSALYFVLLAGLNNGQTLGKKLMNIKVVNFEGKRPTFSRLLIREVVGKFASSVIYGIGFLMILWDRKSQGLHDKIADTYVVKA